MALPVYVKRIYEAPAPTDGTRILVDRLWPRGMTRAKAAVDHWLRELAPSDELRKNFCHEMEKWGEFQSRYARELRDRPESLAKLRALLSRGRRRCSTQPRMSCTTTPWPCGTSSARRADAESPARATRTFA